MPMSNMKYRCQVQDKYKHWFPLEDSSPYWTEVRQKQKAWYDQIRNSDDPYESLDLLIYSAEKCIEFLTTDHTGFSDDTPFYYFIISQLYRKLILICPDVYYFLALKQMSDLHDPEFYIRFLGIFEKIKSGEYTPIDEVIRIRIRRRYREFNRTYDKNLGDYHSWFGYKD